jgi:3'-phosphoadenosine 5'-phosphosulfate sulfotransferase (PAPS reductase)/FAD synthetase
MEVLMNDHETATIEVEKPSNRELRRLDVTQMDLNSYDYYIVAFSGGKDSTACVLHLLDQGVDKNKIELWHHAIDGKEGSTLMDWPSTPAYCKAFAKALGLKYFESWKVGGFEGEMNRDNTSTAPTKFEDDDYNIVECGGEGPNGTRKKFPQVSADLKVRWCSSYLKISVCTMAITNQKRFLGKRTLVISGERAEESPSRSKYNVFEKDYADRREGKKSKRLVDRWRSIHAWSEKEVWDIIERYKIKPHPAYRLGWGRLSCMACIFGNKNQWASVKALDSKKFQRIEDYEKSFGVTIQRKKDVSEIADSGTAYEMDESTIAEGLSTNYSHDDIFVNEWILPKGAFGDKTGPV